jgi:hypothetical protein
MAEMYDELGPWDEDELPECRHCGRWLQLALLHQGWRLIEHDGSVHFCRNTVADLDEFGVVDG